MKIVSTWRFRIILLFILLSLLIIRFIFLKANESPIGDLVYEEFLVEQNPVKIQVPSDWVTISTPEGSHGDINIIGIIEPLRGPYAAITIEKTQPVINMTSLLSWAETRAKEGGKYTNVSSNEILLNGNESVVREYILTYTTLFGETSDQCRAFHLLREEIGYVITFCADTNGEQQYSEIFEFMASTIEIDG
jgi:hypothetical protein